MTTSTPTTPVSPTLVIIRGNSGSGKTTAAREARRLGRGAALVEQDYFRRTVLREHDSAHIQPVAPVFITATVRTALDPGCTPLAGRGAPPERM
ncbi:putative ATPase [Plantactinospora soyae]|uniref:ATPase n=1 Tax=Plantactinospora soyae TaxID=1544732 RepID=A0A927QZS7_9ACTN|nr:putative ATPase [Plantactinospora soyae]